jgi:hypothetical protein
MSNETTTAPQVNRLPIRAPLCDYIDRIHAKALKILTL